MVELVPHIGKIRNLEVTKPRAASGVKAYATRVPAFAFWLLIVFLVLEFIRPHVIAQLQLQLVILLVFPVLWLSSPNRFWSPLLSAQVAFLVWCAKSIPLAYNYYATYIVTRAMYGNVVIGIALTWIC